MKKIALLHSIAANSQTYIRYVSDLLLTLNSLRKNGISINIDIFQPEKHICGLSIEETKKLTNYDNVILLETVNLQNGFNVFPMFEYDYVISNAATAQDFSEKVFYIYTFHGSAPMPMNSKLYMGEYHTFCDAILVSSRANLSLLMQGVSNFRKSKVLVYNNIRTAFRKTYFIPIQPIKIQNFHKISIKNFENLADKYNKNNLIIALLPTNFNTINIKLSLLYYLDKIVYTLVKNFPLAKIIFRPFPADLENSIFTPILKQLFNIYPNFILDNGKTSSTDFYEQCDILITDGSTGGISFLLNTAMPPIYYAAKNIVDTDEIVNDFVNLQKDKVLFAHSTKELIEQINYCINLTKEQRINYFNNYSEKDLFLNVDNKQVFKNIINKNLDDFPYVDEKGNVFNI